MKKTNLFIQTLCAVIASTMCFLFPSLQVAANSNSEFYEYSDSPRYFSVNAEIYQFTLLYPNGLSDYSWNTLETAPVSGIHVSMYTDKESFFVNSLESTDLYTTADIQYISNILAHISPSEEKYDWNEDTKVNISDLIYGVKRHASVPTNFIYDEAGTLMELTNFIDLLNYNIEAGNTDFVVRYGDTVPVVTTTTTTPSSTTTTSTETTTQPTTTSMTSTTTSSTTTSTTTSSTTTTSTTTSSTTTTSTTTSSTTTTSTTTSSTTTTSTTTSSTTTTSTTTSSTTTTSTTTFTPPTVDELVSSYGFGPSDDEYNGLLETAELFGLEYYKIVYSEELIPYSLVIPSDNFTVDQNIVGYLAFQVCPIEDCEVLIPTLNYVATGHEFVVWRPLADDDAGLTTGIREEQGIRVFTTTEDWYFDYYYWCIIPCTLDEETGELVENLTLLYPISE